MKYYVQFMLICLFAVIGEAISTFFKLPIPGSIIGLFLLLIALQLKWIRLLLFFWISRVFSKFFWKIERYKSASLNIKKSNPKAGLYHRCHHRELNSERSITIALLYHLTIAATVLILPYFYLLWQDFLLIFYKFRSKG